MGSVDTAMLLWGALLLIAGGLIFVSTLFNFPPNDEKLAVSSLFFELRAIFHDVRVEVMTTKMGF